VAIKSQNRKTKRAARPKRVAFFRSANRQPHLQ
jgi:hypothetical protein